MNAPTEVRALAGVLATIVGVGATSRVVGISELVAAAVLFGTGVVWLAVLGWRRERRIRARLADRRTRPRPAGAVSELRMGPGVVAPAPSAPRRRPGDLAGTSTIPAGGRGGGS